MRLIFSNCCTNSKLDTTGQKPQANSTRKNSRARTASESLLSPWVQRQPGQSTPRDGLCDGGASFRSGCPGCCGLCCQSQDFFDDPAFSCGCLLSAPDKRIGLSSKSTSHHRVGAKALEVEARCSEQVNRLQLDCCLAYPIPLL